MNGALSAVAVLASLGLSGVGVALALPRARPRLITLGFESVAIGLVVQELVGLVALRSGHYSRQTVLALSLVVIAVSLAIAWLRRRNDAIGDGVVGERESTDRRVGLLVSVAFAIVLIIALLLRQSPSYFIFQTGDMGEYVNDANVLVNQGLLSGSFPHGFIIFLSGTNLLLGRSHTVAGLPALGILTIVGLFAYTRVARLHPLAGLGIAALVAFHPVTVWFSLFPVSESLYAVLLVTALYLVMQARAQSSYAYATFAGLTAGTMLLVRGNAMLLAPIVVVTLLASAAVDPERTVKVQRAFSVVALLALAGAYAYDVRYPRTYFVTKQLNLILPHKLFRIADRAQLLKVSPALLVAIVIALGAVLGASELVTRHVRPRVVDRTVVFWRTAYVATIVSTLVVLNFVHSAGLVDAIARWGPVLLGLMTLGLASLVVRPGRYLDGLSGWVLLLVVGAYSVLFAARVPVSRPAAFYLYWDRYVFSEVLPAALMLAAVGVHVLVVTSLAADRSRVAVRAGVAVVCVVAALAFLPELAETHRITRYPLLGQSYQTLVRLDSLTRTDGVGPIVYASPAKAPAGWIFPNTYRAFALPLVQTFRRRVVGLPKGAVDADEPRDPATALQLLRRAGFDHGYLISRRAPGGTSATSGPGGAGARLVGTVDYVSPILRRSADRSPSSFTLVPMHFDVYALSG